jgi:hypothetical protein
VTSLVLGAAFLGAALVKCVKKFLIDAGISVCVGLLIQFSEPALRSGLMSYYLGMGAVLLVIGSWTLCSYARHTPQQNVEAE